MVTITNIKSHKKSWHEEYMTFLESTGQRNQDVIAGVQYYHDSKASAENKRDKDIGASGEPSISNSIELDEDEVIVQDIEAETLHNDEVS